MPIDQVKAHFENEAPVYDELILRILPGYEEQHALMRRELEAFPRPVRRALDLGCGTGALAQLLLQVFPRAEVVLLDLAEPMLQQALAKLSAHRARLATIAGDFGKVDFGGGYDVVVSGFAIHHLPDPDKRALFARIFQALQPGGLFLLRDVIRYPADEETRAAEADWKSFMRENGADAEKFFAVYQSEDLPASWDAQLEWLKASGFSDVQCLYRRVLGAIYRARK